MCRRPSTRSSASCEGRSAEIFRSPSATASCTAAPILTSRPFLSGVLKALERFSPLAPLHQPNNLGPIRAILERQPQVLQVACFDTAFHRGHPEVADRFAIPSELHKEGSAGTGSTVSHTSTSQND